MKHAACIFCITMLLAHPSYGLPKNNGGGGIPILHPPVHGPYIEVVDSILEGARTVDKSFHRVVVDPSEEVDYENGIVLGKPISVNAESYFVRGLVYDTAGLPGITLSISIHTIRYILNAVGQGEREIYIVGDVSGDREDLISGVSMVSLSSLIDVLESRSLHDDGYGYAVFFGPGELGRVPMKVIEQVSDLAWKAGAITIVDRTEYLSMGYTIAITPSYTRYGEELARYYLERSSNPTSLSSVDYAVGVRSARRSGLDTRRKALKIFRQIYP